MRKYLFAVLALALAALYGYRLDFPAKEYYDEVYHVKTAREFIHLSGNTDTAHPPLGKLIMAVSIMLFGDHSWAWRVPSFACGVLSVLMVFLLARRFFKNDLFAFMTAALLMIDGFSITQSRIAMLNTMMFLFMSLSLWFFVKALDTERKAFWIAAGSFLGLTAATRWVGLGIIAVMGLTLLALRPKLNFKSALFRLSLLVIPAVLIYFSTQLILPFIKGYHWSDLWSYQGRMLDYHAHLKDKHLYGSDWWTWPLLLRPIWYFYEYHHSNPATVNGILCIGNPAIFALFLPAAGWLTWDFFAKRSGTSGFVLAGFLSQWLPWALISRVKFFHYYYAAMPFVILTIVCFLRMLWKYPAGRIIAGIYLAIAAGMFIYWFPLYTGSTITHAYFQQHMWFKRWI